MNASTRKALSVIQERATFGPWATTHADASLAAGLRERTWRRAIGSLVEFKLVSLKATKNGVILSVKGGHFEDGQDGHDGHSRTARVATTDTEDGQDGQKEGKGEYKPSLTGFRRSSFVSNKQLTTNDEQTNVVVKTARGEDGQDGQNEGGQGGHDGHSRTATFWQAAIRLARENGRLEAENAHLRERLARLETPCPTPAPLPIHSTSAPPAGTRGSVMRSSLASHTTLQTQESEAESAWNAQRPVSTGPSVVTPPNPAPASPPSAAPLHPANYRGEILTPLEPGTDPHEDERVFREVICRDAKVMSEMEQDVQLMRLRKDFPSFHRAVASYVLKVARKDQPRNPLAYVASSVGQGSVPGGFGEEGAVSSWAEINKTWLPRAKANPKRRSPAEEKAEAERLAAEDQARCVAIVAERRKKEAERERKLSEQWAEEDRIRAELEAKNKARLVAQFTGEVAK